MLRNRMVLSLTWRFGRHGCGLPSCERVLVTALSCGEREPSESTQRENFPSRPLLLLAEILAELAGAVDGRAFSEVLQFEELPDLHLGFAVRPVGVRDALGPFESLLARLDLDDPVSG